MEDLKTRIHGKWNWPRTDSSRKTIVTFTVRRDGNIENPRISEFSRDQLVDRADLDTVQDASSLAPLPESFPDSITVNFSFNINVIN
ncbi:energy transducer TonB family protein [Synechococcus sp. Nb3U1]|uniref:energy transducer TonB family protein n=1 Tax=Synechococcus sp. Nb3U1 TaxID=1914529 RepID=UPI003FCD6572